MAVVFFSVFARPVERDLLNLHNYAICTMSDNLNAQDWVAHLE
jgi:hypothetical protein